MQKQLEKSMPVNLPVSNKPRIVIIGGGFGGLKLAKSLKNLDVQVVLIDKNNFHTFQPLLYQVATAAMEAESIASPFREIFHNQNNFLFRMAEVLKIVPKQHLIETSIGAVSYDYLVIASGSNTKFFGLEDIKHYAIDMKGVPGAINLKLLILENFEKALLTDNEEIRESLMNIVIVGGGPTGVELAGAFGELKNYIFPKDYPELDIHRMQVHIIDMEDRLLKTLSEKASRFAEKSLKEFNINISLKTKVESYDGKIAMLSNGNKLNTKTLIWAAGVKGNEIHGLDSKYFTSSERVKVDHFNRVEGHQNIFAIGDNSAMSTKEYPKGHPMLAPVAIQQAKNLAENLNKIIIKQELKPFVYKDYGVMATIGKNKAVVDLKFLKINGTLAWLIWVFFHLMSLVGFRNRVVAFVNWLWSYISGDRAARLIIQPRAKNQ
jgi:NADH dehydrogenase